MALWLVLKDFNGAIVSGGSEWTPAGVILDDLLTNVVALQAAGCPMVPWTASPAQVSARNAFLSRSPTPGQPLASENLLDLLATFGAFGGGGGGGGASFTFRPTAVDDPSVNLYGSWASLVAATTALAAAGAPFTITIDLSLLGASFPVPTSTNFGGQAVLRSATPSGFGLQVAFPITLAGVSEIGSFLTIEAVGAGVGGALITPAFAVLILSRAGSLVSNNPNAPLIQLSAGQTLVLASIQGGNVQFGASSAIDVPVGGNLSIFLDDNGEVQNDSISGGGSLDFSKNGLSCSLPRSLAGFAGYVNGGIGSTAIFQIAYTTPLAVFGARGIPLVPGAYFLAYGVGRGIPLATALDYPYRESSTSRARLLALATIWASVDAAAPGAIDVDVLVNGVPVPGMSVAGLNVSTMTTPYQLSGNPVLLMPGDAVSVRVTVPGGGIAASPSEVFCTVETV